MNLGADLLEPFLVRDAEMLLLVDDEKTEVAKLDGLAQQRVRAHDNVDVAAGDALLHPRKLLARDQARGMADLHGKAAKALREGAGVLSGEQRGRHHKRNLPALHGGDEGGAQRYLGLPEPD